MRFTHSVLATAVTLLSCAMQAQAKSPKAVFAHFIVGNAGAFTQDDWVNDIKLAAAVGIDGFALNFAGDDYTQTQLDYAYSASESLGSTFKFFLSIDYEANKYNPQFPFFSPDEVTRWINRYKDHPAQFRVVVDDQGNTKPLVSTFEGVSHAGEWDAIKQTTQAFFVPVWTSAKGTPATFDVTDGAMGWDVWPYGPTGISTIVDHDWKSILGAKPYMMGVSPWFYTNMPNAGKNWLWRGDNLWHDRWQQVLEIQPDFVEILTWNDYGESHYIGPLHSKAFPAGSEGYVTDMAHDGWREVLPYYIDAYKNGNATTRPVDNEKIIYSHRPNPSNSGNTGGTTGNANWQANTYAPADCSLDAINLDVIVSAPSDVTVQIGNNTPRQMRATTSGPNHFLVYFNGETGPVTYTVSRNGATVMSFLGASITPPTSGLVNWNAIVGTS